jgi:CRISPR/Cas system Type II protein with McrA/HNH and RuvC-like nuclease domain
MTNRRPDYNSYDKTPDRFKKSQQVWVLRSQLVNTRIALALVATAMLILVAGLLLETSKC